MRVFIPAFLLVCFLYFIAGIHRTEGIQQTIDRAKAENAQRIKVKNEREYKQKYQEVFGWLK